MQSILHEVGVSFFKKYFAYRLRPVYSPLFVVLFFCYPVCYLYFIQALPSRKFQSFLLSKVEIFPQYQVCFAVHLFIY